MSEFDTIKGNQTHGIPWNNRKEHAISRNHIHKSDKLTFPAKRCWHVLTMLLDSHRPRVPSMIPIWSVSLQSSRQRRLNGKQEKLRSEHLWPPILSKYASTWICQLVINVITCYNGFLSSAANICQNNGSRTPASHASEFQCKFLSRAIKSCIVMCRPRPGS